VTLFSTLEHNGYKVIRNTFFHVKLRLRILYLTINIKRNNVKHRNILECLHEIWNVITQILYQMSCLYNGNILHSTNSHSCKPPSFAIWVPIHRHQTCPYTSSRRGGSVGEARDCHVQQFEIRQQPYIIPLLILLFLRLI